MKKFAAWICAVLMVVLLTVPAFAWGDTQTPATPANNAGLTISRGMSIGILLVIVASAVMMVVSLVTVIMTYKTYARMSDDKKEALEEKERAKKNAKKAKYIAEDEPMEDDVQAEDFEGSEAEDTEEDA